MSVSVPRTFPVEGGRHRQKDGEVIVMCRSACAGDTQNKTTNQPKQKQKSVTRIKGI